MFPKPCLKTSLLIVASKEKSPNLKPNPNVKVPGEYCVIVFSLTNVGPAPVCVELLLVEAVYPILATNQSKTVHSAPKFHIGKTKDELDSSGWIPGIEGIFQELLLNPGPPTKRKSPIVYSIPKPNPIDVKELRSPVNPFNS